MTGKLAAFNEFRRIHHEERVIFKYVPEKNEIIIIDYYPQKVSKASKQVRFVNRVFDSAKSPILEQSSETELLLILLLEALIYNIPERGQIELNEIDSMVYEMQGSISYPMDNANDISEARLIIENNFNLPLVDQEDPSMKRVIRILEETLSEDNFQYEDKLALHITGYSGDVTVEHLRNAVQLLKEWHETRYKIASFITISLSQPSMDYKDIVWFYQLIDSGSFRGLIKSIIRAWAEKLPDNHDSLETIRSVDSAFSAALSGNNPVSAEILAVRRTEIEDRLEEIRKNEIESQNRSRIEKLRRAAADAKAKAAINKHRSPQEKKTFTILSGEKETIQKSVEHVEKKFEGQDGLLISLVRLAYHIIALVFILLSFPPVMLAAPLVIVRLFVNRPILVSTFTSGAILYLSMLVITLPMVLNMIESLRQRYVDYLTNGYVESVRITSRIYGFMFNFTVSYGIALLYDVYQSLSAEPWYISSKFYAGTALIILTFANYLGLKNRAGIYFKWLNDTFEDQRLNKRRVIKKKKKPVKQRNKRKRKNNAYDPLNATVIAGFGLVLLFTVISLWAKRRMLKEQEIETIELESHEVLKAEKVILNIAVRHDVTAMKDLIQAMDYFISNKVIGYKFKDSDIRVNLRNNRIEFEAQVMINAPYTYGEIHDYIRNNVDKNSTVSMRTVRTAAENYGIEALLNSEALWVLGGALAVIMLLPIIGMVYTSHGAPREPDPLNRFGRRLRDLLDGHQDVFVKAIRGKDPVLMEIFPELKDFDQIDINANYQQRSFLERTLNALSREKMEYVAMRNPDISYNLFVEVEKIRPIERSNRLALLLHDVGQIVLNVPKWRARYSGEIEAVLSELRTENIHDAIFPFFKVESAQFESFLLSVIHARIGEAVFMKRIKNAQYLESEKEFNREVKIIRFLIRNHSSLVELVTYGRTKDFRGAVELTGEIKELGDLIGVSSISLLLRMAYIQMADLYSVIEDVESNVNKETESRIRHIVDIMQEMLTRGNDEDKVRDLRRELYEYTIKIGTKHATLNGKFNKILDTLRERGYSDKDAEDLISVYKIAYRSHDVQERKQQGGAEYAYEPIPYVEHLLEVVKILIEVFDVTDKEILSIALLHDVLEDTSTKESALKINRSAIRTLKLLTNPSRDIYKRHRKKLARYYQKRDAIGKIIASGSYAAQIIKAADKIHNLRTLHAKSLESRLGELEITADIFLPGYMHGSVLSSIEKSILLNEVEKALGSIIDRKDLTLGDFEMKRLVKDIDHTTEHLHSEISEFKEFIHNRRAARELSERIDAYNVFLKVGRSSEWREIFGETVNQRRDSIRDLIDLSELAAAIQILNRFIRKDETVKAPKVWLFEILPLHQIRIDRLEKILKLKRFQRSIIKTLLPLLGLVATRYEFAERQLFLATIKFAFNGEEVHMWGGLQILILMVRRSLRKLMKNMMRRIEGRAVKENGNGIEYYSMDPLYVLFTAAVIYIAVLALYGLRKNAGYVQEFQDKQTSGSDNLRLYEYENLSGMENGVADKLFSSINYYLGQKDYAVFLFQTGGSPLRINQYARLAELANYGEVDMRYVVIFMLDTYKDGEDYHNYIVKEFAEKITNDNNRPRIHVIDERSIVRLALAYGVAGLKRRFLKDETAIERVRNPSGLVVKVPWFKYEDRIKQFGGIDHAVIGMGAMHQNNEDGAHVAFNEAGTPFNTWTRKVKLSKQTIKDNTATMLRVMRGGKPYTHAYTVGLQTINLAEEISIIVNDPDKIGPAVRALFTAEGFDERVPATAYRNRGGVAVYADKETASYIPQEIRQRALAQDLSGILTVGAFIIYIFLAIKVFTKIHSIRKDSDKLIGIYASDRRREGVFNANVLIEEFTVQYEIQNQTIRPSLLFLFSAMGASIALVGIGSPDVRMWAVPLGIVFALLSAKVYRASIKRMERTNADIRKKVERSKAKADEFIKERKLEDLMLIDEYILELIKGDPVLEKKSQAKIVDIYRENADQEFGGYGPMVAFGVFAAYMQSKDENYKYDVIATFQRHYLTHYDLIRALNQDETGLEGITKPVSRNVFDELVEHTFKHGLESALRIFKSMVKGQSVVTLNNVVQDTFDALYKINNWRTSKIRIVPRGQENNVKQDEEQKAINALKKKGTWLNSYDMQSLVVLGGILGIVAFVKYINDMRTDSDQGSVISDRKKVTGAFFAMILLTAAPAYAHHEVPGLYTNLLPFLVLLATSLLALSIKAYFKIKSFIYHKLQKITFLNVMIVILASISTESLLSLFIGSTYLGIVCICDTQYFNRRLERQRQRELDYEMEEAERKRREKEKEEEKKKREEEERKEEERRKKEFEEASLKFTESLESILDDKEEVETQVTDALLHDVRNLAVRVMAQLKDKRNLSTTSFPAEFAAQAVEEGIFTSEDKQGLQEAIESEGMGDDMTKLVGIVDAAFKTRKADVPEPIDVEEEHTHEFADGSIITHRHEHKEAPKTQHHGHNHPPKKGHHHSVGIVEFLISAGVLAIVAFMLRLKKVISRNQAIVILSVIGSLSAVTAGFTLFNPEALMAVLNNKGIQYLSMMATIGIGAAIGGGAPNNETENGEMLDEVEDDIIKRYTVNLTQMAQDQKIDESAYIEEITRLGNLLSSGSKKNVVLVGDPNVTRGFIEAVAFEVATKSAKGSIPEILKDREFLYLNVREPSLYISRGWKV